MNQEIKPSEAESIEVKATAVANSQSFEELINTIDEIAPLKGSQQVYSADELIGIIKQVQNGTLDVSYVTSTAGLRQKVSELINLEGEKDSLPEITKEPYKVEGKDWLEFFEKVHSDKTLNSIFRRVFPSINSARKMGGREFNHQQLGDFLDNEAPTRERFISYVERFYQNIAEQNSEENLTKELEVLKADVTLDKMDKSFKMQRIQKKLNNPDSVAKIPDNLEEVADIIYGKK